jgi:hypothetical protein
LSIFRSQDEEEVGVEAKLGCPLLVKDRLGCDERRKLFFLLYIGECAVEKGTALAQTVSSEDLD